VRWSRDQALSRLADPAVLRDLFDLSAVIVDLDSSASALSPSVQRTLGRAPCVTIGVGSEAEGDALAAALDVVVGEGDLARVLAGIEAAPTASRTLVHVLRASQHLGVADALVVESLAYSMLLAGPEFEAWLAARGPMARKPDPDDPVLLDRRGDILHVVLNRPHVHNAYSAALRDGLVDAFDLAAIDPTITEVLVRGNGPSFCSGGDLSEFGTTRDVVLAHAIRTTRSAGVALHALGARARVAVHGSCVGAGVEMPAFAPHVVADPATSFRLPEVAMGLIPGAGGTVSIPRRIGRHRAGLLALTGTAIDAETAFRWGLVDAIGPSPAA
jgi:enoyl-CoA hydratase/carnithine racemase